MLCLHSSASPCDTEISDISPTDFDLNCKNKYSKSKLDNLSTSTSSVSIQSDNNFFTARTVSFWSFVSNAIYKSFSSFTRKGLNLIFLPDDGIVVSNSGTDNEGSAIIFSNQLKYFIKKSNCPSNS